jgi:hypothetical protein
VLRGLAQLVRQAGLSSELLVHARHVAELEQREAAIVPALKLPLLLPGLARHLCELGRDHQTLVEVVRPPRRRVPAVQGIRERRRIPQPPRDRDGLAAEGSPAFPVGLVAQRPAGEAGEQPRPQRTVAVPECLQGPLEQRHKPGVAPRRLPDEPPSVAERCPREVLGQAELLGQVGRSYERLLRRRHVSGPRLGVAQAERELAHHPLL